MLFLERRHQREEGSSWGWGQVWGTGVAVPAPQGWRKPIKDTHLPLTDLPGTVWKVGMETLRHITGTWGGVGRKEIWHSYLLFLRGVSVKEEGEILVILIQGHQVQWFRLCTAPGYHIEGGNIHSQTTTNLNKNKPMVVDILGLDGGAPIYVNPHLHTDLRAKACTH